MNFSIGVVWQNMRKAIDHEHWIDGSRIRIVAGVSMCRFLVGQL